MQLNFNRPSATLLLAGLCLIFLPVLFIELQVLRQTNGHFIYPLDDTFIHLTIAQNLAQGSWGVNTHEFASASSSLLYTAILWLFQVFSSSAVIPFVVNCLAGAAIIITMHLWFQKQRIRLVAQAFIMLLAVFFTPLPLLIVTGMEHTLQCLFSFLFIYYFTDWLERSAAGKGKQMPPAYVLVFAVLTATIRYEGLFLVATACLLLMVHKRLFASVLLGAVAVLPIFVFGIYAVWMGSYFVPNSLLVKSDAMNYAGPLQQLAHILFEKLTYARNGLPALATQRWLLVLPLLYLLFRKLMKPSYGYILILLMAATLLQLSFASTGYLYRYEAYLFFNGSIITAVLFYQYGRALLAGLSQPVGKIAALALAFFLFFPMALRSSTALVKTKQACINIFDQQFQMARFAQQHYNDATIAANDIGALAFYTNAHILDLWGLANIEVTRSRKNGYWTPTFLDSLTKSSGASIAMVYDSWFSDSLTSRWQKVATWQIQDNIISGDDVVSFYSLDSSNTTKFAQELRAYEPQLPKTVVVKYY